MKRQTNTFTAQSDDGQSYTIYEYTDFIDTSSQTDPKGEKRGLKELQTSDGIPVNRIEKGVYKLGTTGAIIRSSSPNAS